MVRVRSLRSRVVKPSCRLDDWSRSINAKVIMLAEGVPRPMGLGTPRVTLDAGSEIPRLARDDGLQDGGGGRDDRL